MIYEQNINFTMGFMILCVVVSAIINKDFRHFSKYFRHIPFFKRREPLRIYFAMLLIVSIMQILYFMLVVHSIFDFDMMMSFLYFAVLFIACFFFDSIFRFFVFKYFSSNFDDINQKL
jgi:hypothetical protein